MNELWRPQNKTLSGVDWRRVADDVAKAAEHRAADLDSDGAFPGEDIQQLAEANLLLAPFPPDMGGCNLGFTSASALLLHDILITIGRGSLSLGRLYEGHINAVALVRRYGTAANLDLLYREAVQGRISGVWMAEDGAPLVFDKETRQLLGRKVLASGAGFIQRPVVAAQCDGGSIMLLPCVASHPADASGWTALGMRATATGTIDFTGIELASDEVVGAPGDYMRSPYFRGGAWRVLAVQLGGLQTLVALFRAQLRASPYAEAPLQLARLAEAAIALESARLWVREACLMAEGSNNSPDRIDAYVDLARNAFEELAQRTIAAAQKAVGLRAFLRPNPLERVIRDLSTYLRQPVLDLSLLSAAKHCLSDEGVELIIGGDSL